MNIFLNYAVVKCCANVVQGKWKLTDDGATCDTLEKITALKERDCVLTIWSGASDDTIFDSAHVNHMFRAWHDYHHIAGQHEFNTEGELAVLALQLEDLHRVLPRCVKRDLVESILIAEVAGQLKYQNVHGVFPSNQKGFIKAYLVDAEKAVNGGEYHG